MYDPISQDPPHDPEFPARMSEFEFTHQDALLNGVIYHPVGEGMHPLILLLHGLPGHERNLDLAQILRRAGWAVCVFHYRGSWGSEGAYRFAHVLEDVRAVIAHFRDEAVSAEQGIDHQRIITIGHSLGGWASLIMASEDLVDSSASLSGVNVGLWGQQLVAEPAIVRPMLSALIESTLGPLHSASVEDIITEIQANVDTWDLLQHVEQLAHKKLLILGAKRDMVVSVFDHHMPLVDALKASETKHLTTKMIKADHAYSGNRIEVARIVLDWLKSL